MSSQSLAPVEPIAVIGTALTLDFHGPLAPRFPVKAQPQHAVRGREEELRAFALSVWARRRRPGCVRVTPFAPRPQPAQKLAGSLPAGLLTANRRAVAAPPSDDRVERQDQVRWSGRLVLPADCSHPAVLPLHRLRAGFDEGLETEPGRAYGILADGAAQEVEAYRPSVSVERVDAARFTRLEFQPSAVECRSDEGWAVLYGLSVRVENHQIIRVAFPRRRVPLAGKRPFEALFQTVQRHVG